MAGWDKEVDLLIVGSGAGSMCAALIAQDHGLEPLIVEKLDKLGGTTAYSGGGVWIPNNHLMEREGQPDSFDRALEYMNAAVWHDGPSTTPAKRASFVRNGRRAIEYIESKGMKMIRAHHWPDYHSDLPGGEQTSRTVMAELFDVNELGEAKDLLIEPKMPVFRFSIEEMSTLILLNRTWAGKLFALRFAGRLMMQKALGKDLRACGQAWQGRMLQIALRNKVPMWRSTAVRDLIVEEGRVMGVLAEREGKPVRIRARRGVLLNSGGFARNPQMRERYGRQPVYANNTNVAAGDTGEMIETAQKLGAAVDCMDEGLWGVSSVGPNGEFPPGAVGVDGKTPTPFGHHFDISLPHVILVDQDGQRFGNEAGSYMELCQRLYGRHTETGRGIPAWAIIESRHRDRYIWGSTLGKTPQEWLDSGYMIKADSLDELAAKTNIDPKKLKDGVARFNGFCRAGKDEDFNRGGKAFDLCHGDPTVKPNASLGAIERPPFYAVRIVPGDVGTWGGLVTDEFSRVLKEDGRPIDGLYAAGAATANVCGRSYP
ncbi:MAG: FAD-binding protein, partial [Caulobacterales bacterium]